MPAFRAHVDTIENAYDKPLVLVNLINQSGREQTLGEAFLQVSNLEENILTVVQNLPIVRNAKNSLN